MPLLPDVTVMNDALLIAVHVHDEGAVTVTLPMVAVFPTDWLVGEIVTQLPPVPPVTTTISADGALWPQAFLARSRTKYVPGPAVAVNDVEGFPVSLTTRLELPDDEPASMM